MYTVHLTLNSTCHFTMWNIFCLSSHGLLFTPGFIYSWLGLWHMKPYLNKDNSSSKQLSLIVNGAFREKIHWNLICFTFGTLYFLLDSYDTFTHILHDWFTGTGALVWLPWSQQSKPITQINDTGQVMNCGCHVTCFCYLLIAKSGNKTATIPWPNPYAYDKICTMIQP